MPRAPKADSNKRHDPLHVQLKEDELHAKYGSVSTPGKRRKAKAGREDEDEDEERVLDPQTSRRIFELAQVQQKELAENEDESEDEGDGTTVPNSFKQLQKPSAMDDDDDDDDDDDNDSFEFGRDEYDAGEYAEVEIDENDRRTLDSLLPASAGERKTLADVIFSKLDASEESKKKTVRISTRKTNEPPDPKQGLNPKVVEVYTKVGFLMERHKSGPLPKVFKVIPQLPAWAQILSLTRPEKWTPQATRAAVRLFISNMKPHQARVFLEGVVLDAIRDDIREHGKLNIHYYEALVKALYKPAAFFKGIVFPLLDSGCSLKEAAIIASVLAKVKVPMIHSAAALMRIAEMDYSGPNSLFIRVLVDKKYALPYKVVDSLVFHFIRLSNTYKAKKGESEQLPVLWHQSLLVFAQRYASDITPEQKDALLDVIKVTTHPQITPEVRRELVSATTRGDPVPVPDNDIEMT